MELSGLFSVGKDGLKKKKMKQKKEEEEKTKPTVHYSSVHFFFHLHFSACWKVCSQSTGSKRLKPFWSLANLPMPAFLCQGMLSSHMY